MTNKRIKIQDLLNDDDPGQADEVESKKVVQAVYSESKSDLYALSSASQQHTSQNNMVTPSNFGTSRTVSSVKSTQLPSTSSSSFTPGYSYNTSLPSSNRLLSNNIGGNVLSLPLPNSSGSGPLPVPHQLPSFHLKSEPNITLNIPSGTSLNPVSSILPLVHSANHSLLSPLTNRHMASTSGYDSKSVSPTNSVSASSSNGNVQYKINKPQGRPIIQSIIGKFTMYANIQDLILDITRFDRIRLRDVLNESLGPFELIRYSKDDLQQQQQHTLNGDQSAQDSSGTNPNSVSVQKNLIINEAHVYDKLRQEFHCQYLKFIKIIRDKKGKLIRLESVIIPNTPDITIDFIKKKICYPRYKSNMKIYLIKCDSPDEFDNKFIYIHDNHSLEDGKNLVNVDKLDKDLEQFKNLTIWCRNE